MTRKDYRKVAASLRDCKDQTDRKLWLILVTEWANIFASDNKRFDRDKFLHACYGD